MYACMYCTSVHCVNGYLIHHCCTCAQPWWGLLPGNNKVTDTLESETMEDRKQMLEQLQNYGARNAENIIPVCLVWYGMI